MIPTDKKLYNKIKKEANSKFLAPTSIYKSAWVVREYKKRKGTFLNAKDKSKGLLRWFREKWVDLNRPGKSCGRKSSNEKGPLCRPTIKITKNTPKLAQNINKNKCKKTTF